jgi:hypothetical protein
MNKYRRKMIEQMQRNHPVELAYLVHAKHRDAASLAQSSVPHKKHRVGHGATDSAQRQNPHAS